MQKRFNVILKNDVNVEDDDNLNSNFMTKFTIEATSFERVLKSFLDTMFFSNDIKDFSELSSVSDDCRILEDKIEQT